MQEACELKAEYQAWDKEMLLSKVGKEKKWEIAKGKRHGPLIAQVKVGYHSQFCTPTYLQKHLAEESANWQ